MTWNEADSDFCAKETTACAHINAGTKSQMPKTEACLRRRLCTVASFPDNFRRTTWGAILLPIEPRCLQPGPYHRSLLNPRPGHKQDESARTFFSGCRLAVPSTILRSQWLSNTAESACLLRPHPNQQHEEEHRRFVHQWRGIKGPSARGAPVGTRRVVFAGVKFTLRLADKDVVLQPSVDPAWRKGGV